jgi:hypothetical protein
MNYIAHHGIRGQKWGVRRYQNEDGSLTKEGLARYRNKDSNTLSREGLKQANKDIDQLNAAVRRYAGLTNDYNKLHTDYYNKETGNTIRIDKDPAKTKALEKEIDKAMAKMYEVMGRSMNSLRDSDYSVGYNYVKDNYYLRKVQKDGVDHWSFQWVDGLGT